MNQPLIFLAIENKQAMSKIRMAVEREGCAVETTDDGLKALNAVRAKAPALLILGDTLFRMDGFTVCRFLKFDDQYRSIPVMLLLSEAHKSDEPLAAEVGADACFLEPYSIETLMVQVKKAAAGGP